jgi:hypothetical protein
MPKHAAAFMVDGLVVVMSHGRHWYLMYRTTVMRKGEILSLVTDVNK